MNKLCALTGCLSAHASIWERQHNFIGSLGHFQADCQSPGNCKFDLCREVVLTDLHTSIIEVDFLRLEQVQNNHFSADTWSVLCLYFPDKQPIIVVQIMTVFTSKNNSYQEVSNPWPLYCSVWIGLDWRGVVSPAEGVWVSYGLVQECR